MQYPALAVYGAWCACAHGAGRGCRAVAGPRRRGDLDDPALGRQRHDRALGRHAAGAHDGERCRASARRRRACARSAPAGQRLDPDRAPRSRSCARAARRDRSRDGRPHRSRRAGAGRRQRRRGLPGAGTACAPRRQGGRLGRGGATRRAAQAFVDETGLGDYSSSALVHVATARVALHEARLQDAAPRWHAPIACVPCSTTAFHG